MAHMRRASSHSVQFGPDCKKIAKSNMKNTKVPLIK